jgi:CrcB protein
MLWLVAAGGAAGSVARVLLGGALARPATGLPLGTLAVNVLGSFAIGVVLRWTTAQGGSADPWRALLASGFCGGFTTFSTFSAETAALLEQGDYRQAALYATLSVAACVLATFIGFLLARRVLATG